MSEEAPVLLVDCGGFFSNRFYSNAGKIIAVKSFQAANAMGYTAMNISPNEFSFGLEFLREQAADITFPLVGSNLVYAEGVTPLTKRHVMVQAGDLKIGIIGVMPTGILDKMPRSMTSGVVEVIPPAEALASIIPGIRKEADILILLSQLGFDWTRQLVETMKGIDLAIYGGEGNTPPGCGEDIQTISSADKLIVPVLKANPKGSHLGYVRMSIEDPGHVSVDVVKMISLDKSVPMDEGILAITGTDILELAAEENKKQKEDQKREIEQLHKLTPKEYIEKLLRAQKEN